MHNEAHVPKMYFVTSCSGSITQKYTLSKISLAENELHFIHRPLIFNLKIFGPNNYSIISTPVLGTDFL